MSSSRALRLLAAFLVFLLAGVGVVFAHDPGLSGMVVTLRPPFVEVVATFSRADVAGLLATGPAALDRERLLSIAPDVVAATSAGRPVAPSAIDADLDAGRKDVGFHFIYPIAGTAGKWTLRSSLIGSFPPGHRQYASVLDTTGRLLAEKLLEADAASIEIEPPAPAAPASAAVPAARARPVGSFILLGVGHILTGLDHLLFVLALVLIVRDGWMRLKTITAFTVAHSITLALATLGYAHIPAAPLNAAIAFSLFLLAPEILRARRGGTSFMLRHPWVVAFAFGLLHGFGFASGLLDLGLPRAQIPFALLLFNVGVEIGQLAFVALVLALQRSFRALEIHWARWVGFLPAGTVGLLGAFWTLERCWILLAPAR